MKGYGLIAIVGFVFCLSTAMVHAQITYKEFYKSAPNIGIPDFSTQTGPGTATATINVPAGTNRTIISLKVSTLTSHTWQGDLRFTLITPWHSTIVMTDRPGYPQSTFGFSADNFGFPSKNQSFTWSDSALRFYDSPWVSQPGINNPTGLWKSEQSLNNAVRGSSPVGQWGFMVQDFAAGETGILHTVDIEFMVVPEPASLIALGAGLIGLAKRRRVRH
jgi:subtilisin-like proprotein convertase family protein